MLYIYVYTRSYSHFSRTNFDDILFSFILIRLIQTVSCLTLWSDNHQWTSQLLINTLFKYKRKELKGNLGCLKGKSPDSHLLRVFLHADYTALYCTGLKSYKQKQPKISQN